MKSLSRFLLIAVISVAAFAGAHQSFAQQGGSSSKGSSSSVSTSQPETCQRVTNQGEISATAPGSQKLQGTLVRENCENGCITGTLKIGDFQCKTLELEWNDNLPNRSCIPVKKTPYICRRVQSPRFGNTFEVTGVEGRTHILFHAGNYPKNTSGCVLLGMAVDDKTNYLLRSKVAVEKFMAELSGSNEFQLTIIDKTGTCSNPSSRSLVGR